MADNSLYRYWLLQEDLIPSSIKCKLVDYFKDAYGVYCANKAELMATGFLTEEKIDGIIYKRGKTNIQKEFDDILDSPFSFVTEEEARYPAMLRQTVNHPYGLFYLGKLPSKNEICVSMVGARNCTAYGSKMAKDIARALASLNVCVVSGMARGIDAYSHKGALEGNGRTIAVLGCGVDVVYPKQNALLYEEIAKGGCIISEYKPHTKPLAQFFPARNRIISGLSQCTIVVEAKLKSGSLITADFALEQGRDVYAVPGRITDPLSSGCNQLINQGAGIITDVEEFINNQLQLSNNERFGILSENGTNFVLEKQELLVYSVVDFLPKGLEQIQIETALDYLCLISIVYELIRKGLIKEVFKNQYIRVN